MSYIPSLPMRPGYTIVMSGTSVPLYSRPIARKRFSLIKWLLRLPTKSDAHRKVIGHVLLIIAGLTAAGIEIEMNLGAITITVTQIIIPALAQEVYDFKWKL